VLLVVSDPTGTQKGPRSRAAGVAHLPNRLKVPEADVVSNTMNRFCAPVGRRSGTIGGRRYSNPLVKGRQAHRLRIH